MEAEDAFFQRHDQRLSYRLPPVFRRSFLARRALTSQLRLRVPNAWLHPRFLTPDEWTRVEDTHAYNVPPGSRGVVVACDGNHTVFLAPGSEPSVLEDVLWLWPSETGIPVRLADDLNELFVKEDATKKVEREATAFLRAAARAGRSRE